MEVKHSIIRMLTDISAFKTLPSWPEGRCHTTQAETQQSTAHQCWDSWIHFCFPTSIKTNNAAQGFCAGDIMHLETPPILWVPFCSNKVRNPRSSLFQRHLNIESQVLLPTDISVVQKCTTAVIKSHSRSCCRCAILAATGGDLDVYLANAWNAAVLLIATVASGQLPRTTLQKAVRTASLFTGYDHYLG